jgi:hypothetical protein
VGIWLTALKVIPWADVIAAAPVVTKGARKLFQRTQEAPALPEAPPAGAPLAAAVDPARVRALEAALAQLAAQQQASAQVLESLADQNAQVVQAIEILRMRLRLLAWLSAGLGAGLLGVTVALLWPAGGV